MGKPWAASTVDGSEIQPETHQLGTPKNQFKHGWKWWNKHFLCKDLVHHPIETTIYKWVALGFQVVFPIIYKFLDIPGGFLAGFLNHQQYESYLHVTSMELVK